MSLWRMILTAISLVSARFGGAGIALASQILLARLLPQSDVGVIFLGMSATAIMSVLVTAGYPALAMVWLPRYYALGRRNLVDAFHGAFWKDALKATVAVALVTAAMIALAPIEAGYKIALLFGLLSSPSTALIRMNSSVANSLRRYQLSYVPDFIVRPGFLLAFLVAAWLARWPLNVVMVLTAFVVGNTIVAVVQALYIGHEGSVPPPFRQPTRDIAPQLRGKAMSLVIVAIVGNSFSDLVNLTGGMFLPAKDVAVLGVCVRLAALIGFVTQATQNFVLPDLAKALTSGVQNEVNSLLLRINTVALGAVAACVLGTVVLGGYAMRLFGPDYVMGHWPLVLFTISQGLRAASGMNQHLLSFGGFQARTAGACLAAMITLGIAARILSPMYGVMGMGYAVVLADLVWAAILAHQAQRYAGRRGDIVALLRQA